MLGQPSDGDPPVVTARGGPVETLPGAVDRATARAPAAAAAAGAAAGAARAAAARRRPRDDGLDHTTTTTTDASTTDDDRPETTTTTGTVGQHVKWTVKPGDTLSSIATQFGTSVGRSSA